jgi:hypothetical protein
MSSMLLGSTNPSVKAQFANLLQLNRSSHIDDTTVQPEVPRLRSAVHASLWRAALKNVPRPKHPKSQGSVTSTSSRSNRVAEQEKAVTRFSMDQQSENETLELLDPSENQVYPTHEESDECLLNSEPESEGQLFDNVSDIGFTDTGESTQTSLDTLFSTQGSSRNFDDDHEAMMLSSPGGLADYEEDFVGDYDACGDMESYDTDMIMADNF